MARLADDELDAASPGSGQGQPSNTLHASTCRQGGEGLRLALGLRMRTVSWLSSEATTGALGQRGRVAARLGLAHARTCMLWTRLTSTCPGCYRQLNRKRLHLLIHDNSPHSSKQRNNKENKVGNEVLAKYQSARQNACGKMISEKSPKITECWNWII